MTTQWHYADQQHQQQGPVDEAELVRLYHAGQVGLETLIWHPGLPQWQALGDFQAALGLQLAAAPSTSPSTSPSASAFSSASPYAPPASPLLKEEPAVQGGEVVYAGFWKRVAAYIIDAVIVGVVGGIIGGIIGGILGGAMLGAGGVSGNPSGMLAIQLLSNLVGMVLGLSYFGWMHASSSMATLGKMAIGIKVVRPDGQRISFARGVGRYFGLIVSSLPLGIGFAMAGFTEHKRALHDMLCDTLVVDKWAFTAQPELQRRELGTLTVVVLVLFGLLLVVGLLAVIGMAAMFAQNMH